MVAINQAVGYYVSHLYTALENPLVCSHQYLC